MKSIFSFVAVTALFAATNVLALDRTSQGCFSSSTGMIFNDTLQYNSRGSCGDNCYALQYATFAMTNSSYCYCGENLPPASTKVDNSKCTIGCPGFGSELCGARGYWNVYITGMTTDVTNAAAAASDTAKSSTASATSSAKPSVVTVGGQTVVVTAGSEVTSAAASSGSASGGGGPSKAGIAAGVVVGVVAIAAIIGGLFLFMRNRKRKEIEEEYKRNAAVSSFISGGKPPTSSGGASSFNDMRLDPAVMAQRRMSDGSIADNQDYSRRILKVTNA
ncbi:hypothetical protein BKA65DRAFT_4983 [Rhexocercosporidium sp. MPI-PUGE-AT-0058]|nr:hypothetical protein BKA65DRAFT_4983 [Rhexocercosporidium sp. MPI-PUGE-AT-0058]